MVYSQGLIQTTFNEWENGFDLVLTAHTAQPRQTVWERVTEPEQTAEWCADWAYTDKSAGTIALHFDDGELPAQIVSCEPGEHVLVEITGLGVVGVSLRDGGDAGTDIVLAHTFETRAAAAVAVPEVGPVWDTHLRFLLSSLGAENTDIAEGDLLAHYAELAERVTCDE